MKTVKQYLHSSKESNSYLWECEVKGNGYDESTEIPTTFLYALYEVEFELEVNEKTGEYRVVSIDVGNGQNRFYETGTSHT